MGAILSPCEAGGSNIMSVQGTILYNITLLFFFAAGPPETDPKTVVFYCAVGYRASIMSQRLLDELKTQQNTSMKPDLDVYNLEGAIFKWANERKDLVDANGNSTPMVHGVDRLRGTLVFKDIKKLGP